MKESYTVETQFANKQLYVMTMQAKKMKGFAIYFFPIFWDNMHAFTALKWTGFFFFHPFPTALLHLSRNIFHHHTDHSSKY